MRCITVLVFLLLIFLCSCQSVNTDAFTDTVLPETTLTETEAITEPVTDVPIPTDPLLYEEFPDTVVNKSDIPCTFFQSGSLSSANGTSMNLFIDWTAKRQEGNDTIVFTADVSLEHERIMFPNTIGTLTIGNDEYVFKTPFFEYDSDTPRKIKLTSVSTVVPCGGGENVMLNVSTYWGYKGTYYNTELDGIKIDAVIPLGESYADIPRKAELDTKVILQNPELPEGCEVTSLAIILNYFGFKITHTDLADNYLPQGKVGEVSFYEYNIGNPREKGEAWGCYAPVIVKTANSYLSEQGTNYRAYNYTGYDVRKLYYEVSCGRPVVVWTTMRFAEPRTSSPWIVDGKKLYWKYPLHCVVLSGYDFDAETVTITDPLSPKPITVKMSLFEQRFRQMESQAVTLKPSVAKIN